MHCAAANASPPIAGDASGWGGALGSWPVVWRPFRARNPSLEETQGRLRRDRSLPWAVFCRPVGANAQRRVPQSRPLARVRPSRRGGPGSYPEDGLFRRGVRERAWAAWSAVAAVTALANGGPSGPRGLLQATVRVHRPRRGRALGAGPLLQYHTTPLLAARPARENPF